MKRNLLFVTASQLSADLARTIPRNWNLVTVTNAADGLSALGQSKEWCAVLAPLVLPDREGISFLKEAAAISGALPLLIAPDEALGETLHRANGHSLFRVIPASTPADILETILRDTDDQFALILQERQLRQKIAQLSITDPLTGCFTRAHLQEHLTRELKRSVRFSHALSIIVCDIDALRNINSAYGYQAGDELLIGFARTTKQSIRLDIDTITRWGEDEFLLVLPETTIRGAGRLATRLQEHFVALVCPTTQGHTVSGTASFGVAGFIPGISGRNATPEQLLFTAGRCLMQAKAAGGNQILCSP